MRGFFSLLLRRWKLVALVVVGILVLVPAGLAFRGRWVLTRSYDIPFPDIAADHSLEGVARGRTIFFNHCVNCHLPPGSDRAVGQLIGEGPFGALISANLTAHPTAGIGRYTDPELARLLRHGVNEKGNLSLLMSQITAGLADSDVAAVMGFLRSDDPVLEPDSHHPGDTRLSIQGTVMFPFVLPNLDLVNRPSIPLPTDPIEYGEYAARSLYDCGGCHTETFSGGNEFEDPAGNPIFSANITFDETGIAGWTSEDFTNALRNGVAPGSRLMRAPMPRFTLPDDEIAAIYAYLKTVPPVDLPRIGEPGPTVFEAELTEAPANEIVSMLGCVLCHGEGGEFEDRWTGLDRKSVDELATWIQDPQAIKPGTRMPNFGEIMSDDIARRLAEWLRSGRPEPAL